MRKYRKKPLVIDAIQWPVSVDEIVHIEAESGQHLLIVGDCLEIKTLEGIMTASPGDWIIRGIQGELYPCKPDIFEATYEPESTK